MHKVNIINLTPHNITILQRGFAPYVKGESRKVQWDSLVTFPPSSIVLSCPSYTTDEGMVLSPDGDGPIPLTYTVYHRPSNLPPVIPNTIYIVSEVVAKSCLERNDFRIVNGVVRDDNGKILGCRSLGRIISPENSILTLREDYKAFVEIADEIEANNALDNEDYWEARDKIFRSIDALINSPVTKG